jgi:hypothetical protein
VKAKPAKKKPAAKPRTRPSRKAGTPTVPQLCDAETGLPINAPAAVLCPVGSVDQGSPEPTAFAGSGWDFPMRLEHAGGRLPEWKGGAT